MANLLQHGRDHLEPVRICIRLELQVLVLPSKLESLVLLLLLVAWSDSAFLTCLFFLLELLVNLVLLILVLIFKGLLMLQLERKRLLEVLGQLLGEPQVLGRPVLGLGGSTCLLLDVRLVSRKLHEVIYRVEPLLCDVVVCGEVNKVAILVRPVLSLPSATLASAVYAVRIFKAQVCRIGSATQLAVVEASQVGTWNTWN